MKKEKEMNIETLKVLKLQGKFKQTLLTLELSSLPH